MHALSKLVNNILGQPARLPVTTEFPLSGKTLGVAYVVGFILFLIGSLLPLGLFLLFLYMLFTYGSEETIAPIFNTLFHRNGTPQAWTMSVLVATSFLGGFGAQLWYLSRLMRKRGYRLTQVIGLSTQSLRGRTWLHTGWAIFWRAAVTFIGVAIAENLLMLILPKMPEQPTMQMARDMSGGSIVLFFLIATFGAALFEEFVFRGVLFQALRSTFHQYRVTAENATKGGAPHKSRIARFLGRTVLRTPGMAEFWSVAGSAAVFAVWHMQFHPVHLFFLFAMGCVLAELFRRTGTLWTSITLHAINNGLMVLLLILSQQT